MLNRRKDMVHLWNIINSSEHGCKYYVARYPFQRDSRNLIYVASEMDDAAKCGALQRSEWFIRAEARSRVAGFLSWLFLQSSWYIFRLGDKWEIIMTSIYRLCKRGKSNVGRTSLRENRCKKYKKVIAAIWRGRKSSIECGIFRCGKHTTSLTISIFIRSHRHLEIDIERRRKIYFDNSHRFNISISASVFR